ncbi:MAG: nuclear transport factor 2 family protein [Chloroflexota bacterium]|nr:nuclear transport factor 2 family protein [Chloroflexota bacterium]
MAVASTLESMARELFDALDRKDFDRLVRLATDDVQGIDEISRGWLRGRAAMKAYFKSLGEHVSNIRSTLSDLHTVEVGDVGILTLVLDQEYDMGGQRTSIHAPTSIVAGRVDGDWRIVLLHSVPLAEES